MISKVRCQNCGQLHDVEIDITLENIGDMGSESEWTQGIFKAVIFKNVCETETIKSEPTIKDAKVAIRELEKEFLNKIIDFENKYGITIQYIETNINGIPIWNRGKQQRTNSVLIYGDL
ncbi:MAG: hypothetical protein PHV53_10960 [Fermentimonas sp.]|nr:hypothetical protein [Fermentimonas sp.]